MQPRLTCARWPEAVHEDRVAPPTGAMNKTDDHAQDALANIADPEWVADLLDTMAAGDAELTAEALEGVVNRLRKASKARRLLIGVPAAVVQAGLAVRAERREEASTWH